jgi:hypothetical protein
MSENNEQPVSVTDSSNPANPQIEVPPEFRVKLTVGDIQVIQNALQNVTQILQQIANISGTRLRDGLVEDGLIKQPDADTE